MSQVFTWYAARDDNFRSPIVRGMGRVKPRERARKRTLTDEEIRDLWAALDVCAEDLPSPRELRRRFADARRAPVTQHGPHPRLLG